MNAQDKMFPDNDAIAIGEAINAWAQSLSEDDRSKMSDWDWVEVRFQAAVFLFTQNNQ